MLTHHLGWVETVMPSSRLGEGSLHKPAALGLEEYSKLHWYNPTKVTLQEHLVHTISSSCTSGAVPRAARDGWRPCS